MKKTDTTNTSIDINQLQSIREGKNISLEALAETLKVTRDYVRHIESGSFEKLGAPTFVRGHVKNYCKELGLPIDEVLQQIPQQYLTVQNLQTPDALGVSPLARVSNRSNHLGRYALGTALLGMLALSFYFVWDKWTLTESPGPQSMILADNNPVDKSRKNITYSSLLPQVKMQQNNQQQTDDVVEESVLMEKQEVLVTEVLEDASNVHHTSEEINHETIEQPSEPNVLAVNAVYSIRLQLDEEAWVSIKTADGAKLEHDLVQPGAYSYQSEQPMHFRIGNAKNAKVEINQVQVDLSEHMRRDIADFNWPKESG